ncbi:MAG TPA: hypothetical protein VMZ92_18980 [Planctomycetota bacterium]|nr:hypothetical protein [Planctomycetota bacterium]
MNERQKPERYRHTQIGTVMIMSLAAAVILLVVIARQYDDAPMVVVLPIGGLLLVVLVLFGTLTVVVRTDEVEVRFGPGLIRKRWALREFVSVKRVRNRWWYGFGIRWIGTGWLYNVSGLDAVELVRRNGRAVRIGTDEPDALETALREAMGAGNARHDAEA